MKRRIVVIALALSLCLCLTGCKSSDYKNAVNNRVQKTGRLIDHEETSSTTSITEESAKAIARNRFFQR